MGSIRALQYILDGFGISIISTQQHFLGTETANQVGFASNIAGNELQLCCRGYENLPQEGLQWILTWVVYG